MKRLFTALAFLVAAGLTWAGCSQNTAPIIVRSLERSGKAAFLCIRDPVSPTPGAQLDTCFMPGNTIGPTDYTIPHFISLVTQTARGEIAVVDVSADTVIDVDKTVPGYNFLPMGAQPTDIVATPGSNATFVGVGDPTRPGIFAIPSSKLPLWRSSKPPRFDAWPACALPPGGVPTEMLIVADTTPAASEPTGRRAHCDGSPQAQPEPGADWSGVDLSAETQLFGRLKLIVTLPELGEIDVIDAQDLLHRQAGSFDPCEIERRILLTVDGNLPPLPPAGDAGQDVTLVDAAVADVDVGADADDGSLVDASVSDGAGGGAEAGTTDAPGGAGGSRDAASDGFVCTVRPTPSAPRSLKPHPYALALADDGRLFVSDDSASVIHVVDMRDPCAATEKAPLLPFSAADPQRAVVSGAIAVSPLTTDGKRFVYASDVKGSGTLMVFDVSTTSTERTPILRPDLKFNPNEPPDRVVFPSPIESMTFATHEIPLGAPDPNTGVVPRGVLCNPADANDVNKPAEDFLSAGAQPRRLRGTFGFIALSSGDMNVLDLDDFDAPCRRPRFSDDPALGCEGTRTEIPPEVGLPATSQEVSCKVIERHRPRSASFFTNAPKAGRHAPAMLNVPFLYDRDGTAIISDESRPETAKLPRLLGPELIEMEHDAASWELLSTVLSSSLLPNQGLSWDPNQPSPNWVTFDLREPRAHVSQVWTVTYEGNLPWFSGRRGRFQCADPKIERSIDCEVGDNPSHLELYDSSVGFCDGGTQGEDMTPAGDILEIIDDMPDPADPYWSTVVGRCSRQDCEEVFGTLAAPRVLDAGEPVGRDILIAKSYQGKLSLKNSIASKQDVNGPRHVPVTCCFPYPVAYTIRAGHQWIVTGQATGFAHHLVPDPKASSPDTAACIESCDENLALRNGRVRALTPCTATTMPGQCDPVPTYDRPGFQNAQLRFSLWDIEGTSCENKPCSGRVRDRYFAFQEVGGFVNMRFGLSSSALVLPQSVRYVRGLDMLAIPDSNQMGLMLFDLNRLQTTSYFY